MRKYRKFRLTKYRRVELQYRGTEVDVIGANDEIIATFDLKRCIEIGLIPSIQREAGEWGEWALRQRERINGKKKVNRWKKGDEEWKAWASNKVASLKLRKKRRPDRITRSAGFTIHADRKAPSFGWREWEMSEMRKFKTKLKKADRDPWQIWSETKACNSNTRVRFLKAKAERVEHTA